MDRVKGDERILGDTDFVLEVLAQSNERLERKYALKHYGYDLNCVAERVAELYCIDPDDIFHKGRQKSHADARGLFCYWCTNELGLSQSKLARKLEMTVSGVGYAAKKGASIAKRHRYVLIDQDT